MPRLPATAVIFCGGRSTRMGEDKALFRWRGRPLALHVVSRVRPLFAEILVSGDPGRYRCLGMPCVPDPVSGIGPLAGLYAGLLAARTHAVFAVACDMPFLSPGAILTLWTRFRSRDAAVPVSPGGPEPLHAFYSRRLLPSIGRALGGKPRMTSFWGEADVARVPIAELPGGEGSMRDCDTPADLR